MSNGRKRPVGRRRRNECVQSTPIGQPELDGDQHPHRDRPRFIVRRFEAPLTDGVGCRAIELDMARGLLHGDVTDPSIGLDMDTEEVMPWMPRWRAAAGYGG